MPGYVNRDRDLYNENRIGYVSKMLRNLSRLGMKFDDQVIKNSRAIGVKEKSYRRPFNNINQTDEDIWNAFASMTMADGSLKDSIAFFDKDYSHKREELNRFALNDEIEDALDILTDECIIYDNDNFACNVSYNGEIKEELRDEINTIFKKVYYYYGFADGHRLWDYFRKWLIEGYLCFEIIYDKAQKNIIGFKELDVITLRPSIITDSNGKTRKVYIQQDVNGGQERVLYDSQVVYISYSQMISSSRVSYVEKLIRSFNLLRIMEHTRVIWAVTNSSYKMKFVIPVGGKSKTRAKQSLSQLMHNYREDISFNNESGELKINGKPQMQFSKQFWLPSKDGESPEIETLGGEGPDISDTEALRYFVGKFRDATKIPYNRFDKENPVGYELAAEGVMRDEIRFSKFIARLRSKFRDIIIKPVYNQIILNHPELENDESFRVGLNLVFHKENVFEEMKQYELMQRRIDTITALKDSLTEQDADMNDIPIFDLRFLVDKILIDNYLNISREDMEQNDKYKRIAKLVMEGYKRDDAIKIEAGESKDKFKKEAKSEDEF